jgi:hypothetical protein
MTDEVKDGGAVYTDEDAVRLVRQRHEEDMADEWNRDGFTEAHADRGILLQCIERLSAEIAVLREISHEYFQWPGKAGQATAPEWLQHRLKYGGANIDGDMLAVYDWHDRRSLAAPGDYVVDGEKGLWVLSARKDTQ